MQSFTHRKSIDNSVTFDRLATRLESSNRGDRFNA